MDYSIRPEVFERIVLELKEQQEKLDKERSLRTFKDEIVSLAVYQAINCEHANNPEKTEQAARIRETLIDCYRK